MLSGTDNLEDLCVHGGIILQCILNKYSVNNMKCNKRTMDGVPWMAFAGTVMNHLVPYKGGGV